MLLARALAPDAPPVRGCGYVWLSSCGLQGVEGSLAAPPVEESAAPAAAAPTAAKPPLPVAAVAVADAVSASGGVAMSITVTPARGYEDAAQYIASVGLPDGAAAAGAAAGAPPALHRQTKVVQIKSPAAWPTTTFDGLACTALDVWVLACSAAGCSDKRRYQ